MKKISCLLVVFVLSLSGYVYADEGEGPVQRRIIVTAAGTAERAPDMAVLSLVVMREAATAREALDANSAAMEKVIAHMKSLGIAGRDLQTSAFSISPRYSYPQRNSPGEERKLLGYTVRNGLTVRVRNIDSVGEILDASVSLGVNEGGNVQFTNDDPSEALEEARTAAVKEATAKARTLAASAGVKLGPVEEISEKSRGGSPLPVMRAEMAMASAEVPIQGGENSYSVTVTMTFAIAN